MVKKGELTFDTLIPWIITLGTLAIILFLYSVLSGKTNSTLDFLKDLWRFGR
ncbi:MAG: hypothetical protein AABX23_03310 [Nanoarchaeota archaeon]